MRCCAVPLRGGSIHASLCTPDLVVFCLFFCCRQVYGYANNWGVLYGGDGKQLGMQVSWASGRGGSSKQLRWRWL